MKKIAIGVSLCLASIAGHAQSYFQLSNTNPSATTYETSTGLVGIGTAGPTSTLTVAASGTSPASVLEVINSPWAFGSYPTANNGLLVKRNVAAPPTGGVLTSYSTINDLNVSSSGLTGIGVSTPAAHLDISDQNGDGLPLLRAVPPSSTTPALWVDNSGIVSIGMPAMVGVGIDNFKLQVMGDIGVIGKIGASESIGASELDLGGPAYIGGNADITGNEIVQGNLSVGTASPSNTGQVQIHNSNGQAIDLVYPNTTGWGNQIKFFDHNNNLRDLIYDDYDAGTSAGDLVIQPGWYGHGSGVLQINGKVRINDQEIYLRGSGDANNGLGYYGNTGGSKVWNANVAGTSTPISVDGPVLYGYSGGALGTTNGGQNAALLWNNSGQVIIGNVSSTPSGYRLLVQGGILTEKVKVALSNDATNWSDYVFNKDYKLPSLKDLEKYIKLNKHLPGVPSTQQVHSEGIDLAEMDATLLKKIEELTLYILKQQNEIDNLKSQKVE